MITIRIIYSNHALEKVDRYGIDVDEVERTIKQGMKWKENDTEKWHANRGGIECVFMKQEEIFFIITVYQNKGRT